VTIYFPDPYVATYTADEPVTWSLTGTDATLLNIDASGVVTVIDTATIRDFSFNVVATDLSTNGSSLAVTANGVWSPGFATTSLWLDAADANTITETAGSVSQWDDKSGNARHATQSTPGQKPTYGAVTQNSLNTVTFDGSNDNLDIASTSIFTSGNSDIGIFAAYKPTAAPGSRGAIFGNFSTGNLAVYFGDDAPFVEPWGVYNNADIDLSTDSYVQNGDYIASIVRSDGNFTGWTAGNQNETVANTDSVYAGAGTASTWSIGDTTSGQNASLDLWEFATIDGSISTPERERFEGYLAWKWGLEANLPPTHYWKNEPPNETALTQWSLGINTAGTFTLITNSTCNVDIDWGDGNVQTSVVLIGTTNTEHIYSSAGEYLIKLTLNSGDFRPLYNNDAAGDELVTLGDTPAGWSFGTNLSNAFYGSANLTTVGDIDTSAVTSFSAAWFGCTSLESFPEIDVSSSFNFSQTWRDCNSLKSFPELDTSIGTNFFAAWLGCSSLTSFPELDVSIGANFGYSWGNCYSLTSFPQLNISSGTYFFRTWGECIGLTSFPALPTGKRPVAATNFNEAWFGCNSLTTFPANFFDDWTGTPDDSCFANTWTGCSALTPTSVENILNSIGTSGQLGPASGNTIDIDYNAATGTPNIQAVTNILSVRDWDPTLNGVSQPSPFDSWALEINTAGTFTLISGGTVNVDVDWGDGSAVETVTTNSAQHIYPSAGVYYIAIKINSGDFTPFYKNNAAGAEFVTIGDTPTGWSFGTSLSGAFYALFNLTAIGDIDTSSVMNFQQAWQDCSSLASFPPINTSNGELFGSAWLGCSNLTSFPSIDTSSGTEFSYAWFNCSSLQSFPPLNTSGGTNFFQTWADCKSLTSFPAKSGLLMDVSNSATFYRAWYNCILLETFPPNFFDTWSATPDDNCFVGTWDRCSTLTATSVENILNSINTSGQSAPASGVDITIDYDAGTGTPNITTAVTNLKTRNWTITLNGVPQ
jgi:hypothetical protein